MPDRSSFRFRLPLLLLALAAVYLVGNERMPLWDRDEPRYATASREMARTGDWVVPMYLDEPRTKKPILIYWLQAASMKVFGETAAAARLPSVVAALLSVTLLALVLRQWVDQQRAWWATFVFATSAMVIASAKMCLTDAVLLLWILAAQLSLFAIVTGRSSWRVVGVFGLAVGMAGLTKGPVVLGVIATTLAALVVLRLWDRKTASGLIGLGEQRFTAAGVILKSLLAIALVAAVLLPWLVAMESRIPGYTWNTIRDEVIERAGKPQEGHAGPPGYYLLTIWATYFPWSLLLPGAIIHGWRNRDKPIIRFALAAVVGPWLMLEIVRTKLPHYLLPVFPFLALLTADMIVQAIARRSDDLSNRQFRTAVTIWTVLVALVALSIWIVPFYFEMSAILIVGSISVSIAGIAYALAVWRLFVTGRAAGALSVMGAGFLGIVIVQFSLYLPAATFLRLSPRVASVLIEHGARAPGSTRMIDYKEPSLAFYQGGTIREEPRDDLLSTVPPDQWPDYLVLTARILERTPPQARQHLDILATFRGLNYAAGRVTDVIIARKRATAGPTDTPGPSTAPLAPGGSN